MRKCVDRKSQIGTHIHIHRFASHPPMNSRQCWDLPETSGLDPATIGRIVRFPAVGNVASIQAGSRDIREIPDPSRSLALGSKDDFPAVRSKREPLIMCDYSLHLVANRPARVGDELVSTRFRNPMTRGFVAIGEPDVAVCLLPGSEVAFEARRGMRRRIPLFSRSKSQAEGRALPGRSILTSRLRIATAGVPRWGDR